jgi:cation diffusion facilitator family transporter
MDRPPRHIPLAPADKARARGIQRTTFVAICTNSVLAIGQLTVGLFANAFSLVADAVHTLSDLFTDVLVLLAGRHGADPADLDHPYGHGRIETVATLLLSAVLAIVGIMFLWSSGVRLQNMEAAPPLHYAAIYMAFGTLVAKELLFRYTLAASKRLKAPVLEANAWHARSDAASSLVVTAGIGGSLAGYPFLEPLAAAVVGFLIAHMGVRLGWKAVRELIDTGLPAEDIARLRTTIRNTPGVLDLHDLRTRRMADRVLCDTHVLVDPRITVSEGHRISDQVYFRIRNAHPEVREVLVHIDAEDDDQLQTAAPGPLPERTEVLATIRELLGSDTIEPLRVQLHYLGDRVEAEVVLRPSSWSTVDPDALKERVARLLSSRPQYRSVTFLVQVAP